MLNINLFFYFRDLKEALGKEIKDREAEAKLLKNLITDNAKVTDTLIIEFWLWQIVLKNMKSLAFQIEDRSSDMSFLTN